MVGGAIIAAWLVGLALLVRREYFRPQLERLAEAALRVTPGAVYYGVMQGDRQVGFASSTIDTAQDGDHGQRLPRCRSSRRRQGTARDCAHERHAVARAADAAVRPRYQSEGAPIVASGRVEGDSDCSCSRWRPATAKPDTQRIALSGPILLPTLVPLASRSAKRRRSASTIVLPMFDPASMAPKDVGFDVRAESLFVVNDSSVFDAATQRWHGVGPTRCMPGSSSADASGGILGMGRRAGTYRGDEPARLRAAAAALRSGIRELADRLRASRRYARIATSSRRRRSRPTSGWTGNRLASRSPANVDLAGFDLTAQRQRLSGDTLTIDAGA